MSDKKKRVNKLRAKTTLFFMTFVTLLLVDLKAQDIQTVELSFDKIPTTIVVNDSLQGYDIMDYIFYAKKGQFLTVGLTTDNNSNYFNIMEPKEEYVAIYNSSLAENAYKVALKKTGDYKIRVYLMRSAARRKELANFELSIGIEDSDALVTRTDFHATGQIPCMLNEGDPATSCKFGVKRGIIGSAVVTIVNTHGESRTIVFESGSVKSIKVGELDSKNFTSKKEQDTFIIKVNDETYEVPEAIVIGG